METQVCSSCGKEFPLTNEYFAWRNKSAGTYRRECRECDREYQRKRRTEIKKENGERLAKRRKTLAKYYQGHKSQIKEKHHITNGRKYWGDEEFSKRTGVFFSAEGKEKKYVKPLRDELLEKKRKYRSTERGKEANREYVRKYQYDHWHNDPQYHAIVQVRNFLQKSFKRKGEIKSKRNVELTGKTSRELYEYLLKTFEETYGHPWDFQEPVHIDHITPLATATTPEEIERLCHYTNLRLIKAKDNWEKNKKTNYQINADVLPEDE